MTPRDTLEKEYEKLSRQAETQPDIVRQAFAEAARKYIDGVTRKTKRKTIQLTEHDSIPDAA